MKVLLAQAYLGGSESPVFPLGLGYLKSSIGDHEVRTFDPNVSADPHADLAAVMADFKPDLLGISLRNIDSTNKINEVFYYPYLKEMIKAARKASAEGLKIAVGGPGFSMFAETIMEDEPAIDFGVFLEGEKTFPDLLKNIDGPQAVKGIYYRADGRVLFSGFPDYVDPAGIPRPDRQGIGLDAYRPFPDSIGVETKRGCMLGCVYCVYGFLNGRKMRLKDPAAIVDEIEEMVKGAGIGSFTFVDSVFNLPLSHAEDICREMVRRDLKVTWSAWFHERHMNEDFLALVKEAGCNKVVLSPDGFSDRSLALLGKDVKKRDIIRTYELLKENIEGIEVCYNFFKNPPGQSWRAFLGLLLFVLRAKAALGRRIHFEFNSIRIEPYTKLFEMAVGEGLIDEKDDLLQPRYYSNKATANIERLFNLLLRMKDGLKKLLGKK